MQDEKSFLAFLNDKKKKLVYLKEKRAAVREAKTLYKHEKETYQRDLEEGIRHDREHRDILNACIFPFVNTNSEPFAMGYHFIRACPLAEVQVENMDFLIMNSDVKPVAIAGEVKGSAEDPDTVVTQTKSRMSLVLQYRSQIESEYLKTTARLFEFVLGVYSLYAIETAKSIQRKKIGLIPWHVDRSQRPVLTIAVLPTSSAEERQIMMHSDHKLNSVLSNKVETSTELYTFYQQSHTYTKLLVLTMLSFKLEGPLTFSEDDVKQIVSETMPYAEQAAVDAETTNIILRAEEIGFIRRSGGKFSIVSKHRNASGLSADLKKRWLVFSLKRKREDLIQNAIEEIQEKFRTQRDQLLQHAGNWGPLIGDVSE